MADLLRAGSLLVVVFGHVLMAVVVWRHGTPKVGNLLAEVPELKITTWALQVMPLFFAAGAIANRLSYASACARGEPWRTWLWHRVRRLIRPSYAEVPLTPGLGFALLIVGVLAVREGGRR